MLRNIYIGLFTLAACSWATGSLLKILHWPFGNEAILIAYFSFIGAVLIKAYLLIKSNNKNSNNTDHV